MTKDKEQRDRYAKETYEFRKKRGFCVKCGKNRAFHNFVMCPECIEKDHTRYANRAPETEEQREKRNLRRSETYRKRKENGLCVRCGKKKNGSGTHCAECCIKHKRAKNEWRMRNGLKKGYADAGLCIRCGDQPVEGRNLCKTCLEKQRESARCARCFIPRQMKIEIYF